MKGYDYSSDGAYFVTICAREREALLGEVVDGVMLSNDVGRLVDEIWHGLPRHFPNMELNEWVVMPNHVHGIIWIASRPEKAIHGDVGARFSRPEQDANGGARSSEKGGRTPPLRRTLGQAVAYFKHQSTKAINVAWDDPNPAIPVWQRNYYERIIRNDEELDRIRQYIRDHPKNWDQDPENLPAGERA